MKILSPRLTLMIMCHSYFEQLGMLYLTNGEQRLQVHILSLSLGFYIPSDIRVHLGLQTLTSAVSSLV